MEGQKWYQKLKLWSQPKSIFRTIPNTTFDKTILQNYFLNCFSYKIWEKKSLSVKIFVLRERLKNKQIAIPMHHIVIRLPLEPSYLPKRSNLTQNNFFTWKYNLRRNFCYGISQEIRILRLPSDDNLFRNRPRCKHGMYVTVRTICMITISIITNQIESVNNSYTILYFHNFLRHYILIGWLGIKNVVPFIRTLVSWKKEQKMQNRMVRLVILSNCDSQIFIALIHRFLLFIWNSRSLTGQTN